MEQEIEAAFEKMGARARVTTVPQLNRWVRNWNGTSRERHVPVGLTVDISRDETGEFFSVFLRGNVTIKALDVRPAEAHLLLQATMNRAATTSEFLCGHDERAWFVAAIPEASRAQTVQDAKDALKPQAVWDAIREHAVPMTDRDHRRTAAFVRQGEWFFIPRPAARINSRQILRNEPIRRGRGNPHTCQFMYRYGGEDVFVSDNHPNGLTLVQYRNWPKTDRARQTWERVRRGATVFVRGAIMHPEHDTLWLDDWHEVVMNRESESAAMQHVAFLD